MAAEAGTGADQLSSAEPRQGSAEDGSGGTEGLRDRLAALAGRPGAANERLGAERDAINGLRVTAGQVFAGSQHVYNFADKSVRVEMLRLSPEEIEETRQAFVRPGDFADLVGICESQALTLLSGPAGAGKCAAARALMLETGPRAVFLLKPATDLVTLHGADLERSADFILADLSQDNADRVTDFDLRRLKASLAKRDCRLIVTVESTLRITDQDVRARLVPYAKCADGRSIVEAHVKWRMGAADAARAATILERADMVDLLDDALDEAPASRAGDLGRLIADAAVAGPDDLVAESARSRLDLDDGQSFALWFEKLSDLPTQCLAIGVAVFGGGETYETVASLSAQLVDLLQIEESPDNPARERDKPFTGTRSRRLAAIGATLAASTVATRYGEAHGQLVRYQDEAKPVEVLHHVWDEYDQVREALPTWLRNSAANELPTVGVRAAVAAGVLAEWAFDQVQAQILLPWAADQRQRVRDAAAVALHVAATKESGRAEAACNLVFAWSADEANAQLRSTASRAWRVIFERDGAAAFGLLHSLAAGREELVTDSVCWSLTEYMAMDEGRHCLDALDLIAQWVEGGYGPHYRLVGEHAFLYASADLVDREPGDPPDGPVRTSPSLLAAAGKDTRIREIVARLWSRAVNSPDVFESAHQILGEWVVMVDPDPRRRADFVELIAAAAVDERTMTIIRHEAAKWVHGIDGRAAHRTARAVLDRIPARNAQ